MRRLKVKKVHISFLLAGMQSQNSSVHARLHPEFDTMFMHLEKHSPQTEVANLRADLTKLQKFDPAYNPELLRDFEYVIKKGIDSGLHWKSAIRPDSVSSGKGGELDRRQRERGGPMTLLRDIIEWSIIGGFVTWFLYNM